MIDNNIFISSATLIPDMYNDYNIQSDDFVSGEDSNLAIRWAAVSLRNRGDEAEEPRQEAAGGI